MLRLRNWQGAAVVLACWGLLIPQTSVRADTPTAPTAASQQAAQKAADVSLTDSGLLVGSAFTPDGKPLDGALVSVTQAGERVAQTNTDQHGSFAIAQMKTGTYQIGIGDKVAPIRVWTNDAAPPNAKEKAVLVTGEIIRGQGTVYEEGYGAYEYCPDGNCPPGGGGPLLGLDVITLATVGAATTAAVVTIINLNKLNDLEDELDEIASP
jgi:hypothetical protein